MFYFFLEIFFIQTNLIYYTDLTENFPPIWIICLYPLFSLLLNHSLKFIKRNYLISFLFGFLGGPLSYIGGQALGAVNFSYPVYFIELFLKKFLELDVKKIFFYSLPVISGVSGGSGKEYNTKLYRVVKDKIRYQIWRNSKFMKDYFIS